MKRWTETEVAELRRLRPTTTCRELAEMFGVTPGVISKKCCKLGIMRGGHPNTIHLTPQQELWLKLNFPHMANAICALALNICPRSVVSQARRLGLQKTAQFMKEARAHASRKAKERRLNSKPRSIT